MSLASALFNVAGASTHKLTLLPFQTTPKGQFVLWTLFSLKPLSGAFPAEWMWHRLAYLVSLLRFALCLGQFSILFRIL